MSPAPVKLVSVVSPPTKILPVPSTVMADRRVVSATPPMVTVCCAPAAMSLTSKVRTTPCPSSLDAT